MAIVDQASSFRAGLRYAVRTPYQAGIVAVLSVLSYVMITLSSFPEYSVQILSFDLFYLPEAVSALTMNTYQGAGLLGVVLVVIYAVFTGIAIVNLTALIRATGWHGAVGAGSMTPALFIGGCAGCGAGLLGLVGMFGALAVFPFDGNLVRLGGIALLVVFLTKTGNPRTCDL